jgi:methylated-DNA-[protein]-cysteine S-methyltransferase
MINGWRTVMAIRRAWVDCVATPIGDTIVACEDAGSLVMVSWDDAEHAWRGMLSRRHGDIEITPTRDPFGCRRALEAYMGGDMTALVALRVSLVGTEFQRRVWGALRAIPTGETRSYGELARAIRNPKAVRAVGLANGANPVAIVVPCHRVIGSDGSLTGFGGGLDRKRWLLAHEARHARGSQVQMAMPM